MQSAHDLSVGSTAVLRHSLGASTPCTLSVSPSPHPLMAAVLLLITSPSYVYMLGSTVESADSATSPWGWLKTFSIYLASESDPTPMQGKFEDNPGH